MTFNSKKIKTSLGNPNLAAATVNKTEAKAFFDSMVLSASGWRGVFGQNEDDLVGKISAAKACITSLMAGIFADYLIEQKANKLALAMDSRPSGPYIADAMARIFLTKGLELSYASVCAAPEIMAWTRLSGSLPKNHSEHLDAFCYISASHNPPGHNGLKFGMNDGGVLPVHVSKELTEKLKQAVMQEDFIEEITKLSASADEKKLYDMYKEEKANKKRALTAYTKFSMEVLAANSMNALSNTTKSEAAFNKLGNIIKQNNIGIVIDMNGSARSISIDKDFFTQLGVKVKIINGEAGRFAHRIVPEGASLEPCRLALELAHKDDPSYVLAYVPDCDGDRGNIVFWDDKTQSARAMEAQESFALAVLAELACMAVENNTTVLKMALACNDATSLRIEAIALAFGVDVYRSETGEANVTGLADSLRGKGYTVRVLGEGSNGGVITHPAKVRDPVNTVLAILRLLLTKDSCDQAGPYKLWLKKSGQEKLYKENFSLSDILDSLPVYTTTSVFEDRAALRIKSKNHLAIKNAYQSIWEKKQKEIFEELTKHYGPVKLKVSASSGFTEKELKGSFSDSGTGGLKFVFFDQKEEAIAFLWMRGSGTEPVFRVMADVKGSKPELETWLLFMHAGIVKEADILL